MKLKQHKWDIKWGDRMQELPTQVFRGKHLINHQWRDSQDGATMTRESPAHKIIVGEYAEGSAVEVDEAVRAAQTAYTQGQWRFMSGKERAKILTKTAELIETRLTEIAYYEALESGKPMAQAVDEIKIAMDLWHYAAALARTLHGDSHNNLGERTLGIVIREPIGVVGMITPWNFPFLIASQKLPFALAAGCCCVLKPSELTCATTIIMMDILLAADLPTGVVNLVLGTGEKVGKPLIAHPHTDMSSFTGSTPVGKQTASAAAANLKKVSLELGGKNPQVILPDCDWEFMIDTVVFGMCFNAGECCNSGSRALVHQDIVDRFIEDVSSLAGQVPIGDPLHPLTKMGPIISAAQQEKIDGFVQQATRDGAKVALGGSALPITAKDSQGLFYQPTLIHHIKPTMAVAQEEIFGPVLSVIPFKNNSEMLRISNECAYGLSAGIWSSDINTCINFARRVQAGTVWINGWMEGFAELPFGGMKRSGLGRELGRFGMEEFTEIKTIQIHSIRNGKWLD